MNETYAKEITVPIAYPVEVILLYPDYEPFEDQNTRGFTEIYHYHSPEEAESAEKLFLAHGEILLPPEDKDLLEVNRPNPDGVVFRDTLNVLTTIGEDLRNQLAQWSDSEDLSRNS